MPDYKNNVDARLKKFIDNIERLEEDKADLAKQVSDVYKEAKTAGFDTKTMKKVIALRKLDQDERHEQEQMLSTYKEALGMIGA